MAHEICEEKIMYVGERPWHGIGRELQNPATSREAIVAAGLDYEIALEPIHTQFQTIDNAVATVRVDNGQTLGIVSPKYKIFQNRECFDFFDSVVGEKAAMYHTAGALGKGERIWLLAKLPGNIIVYKDDVVEKFLCLSTGHNGKFATEMYFTPIRVVCQNTLSMSMENRSEGVSIRHSGDLKSKVNEAKRLLGLSLDFYKVFEQQTQTLVKEQMDSNRLDRYFNTVIFGRDTEDEEDANGMNRKFLLNHLFESGKGNNVPGVRGTAWAAYNAVTEMVDYHSTIRNVATDASNRLKNIWFGAGAKTKREAFSTIMSLMKG